MDDKHILTLLLTAGLTATACSGATTSGTGSDDTTEGGSATTQANDETAGTCGDGVAEGAEPCDGNDLNGLTCPSGGTLTCTSSCTLDTTGCTVDPTMAVVRLNEIVSDDVVEGPYAGAVDAIEIYNVGGTAADLSGWKLSDDPTLPDDKTYVFIDGTTLAPGELLVLVQLDDVTGTGDYPFGISGSNPETLTLADPDGTTIDSVSFQGASATVSWCRLPDGDGEWQVCMRTLGELNAGVGGDCGNGVLDPGEGCDGTDLGGLESCTDVDPELVGPLACTAACTLDMGACEAVPAMGVVLNEVTSSGNDEIEIYNFGRTPIDLSAYVLTDDLTDPGDPYDYMADLEKLVFLPGTVLAAGDRLVVIQGAADDEHPFGLATTGDAVTLLTPGLVVVDFVAYGDGEAADSYCRLPDGPAGEWTAGCTPTFGDPNAP